MELPFGGSIPGFMFTTGKIPHPEPPKNLGYGLERTDPDKLKTSETKRADEKFKSHTVETG